jgi:hypothetical protein
LVNGARAARPAERRTKVKTHQPDLDFSRMTAEGPDD